jgi:hypothetical protein
MDVGLATVDWANGRPYADFGRLPGPTLLAKLPLDVLREDAEVVRVCEDTDDENEVFLATPTMDWPLMVGRGTCGAAIDLGSPALSASVLRFGSGSLSVAKRISIVTL